MTEPRSAQPDVDKARHYRDRWDRLPRSHGQPVHCQARAPRTQAQLLAQERRDLKRPELSSSASCIDGGGGKCQKI
jgi:hypothetical protein